MKWFNTLSHNRWLEQETDRILDFGKNAAVTTGFGWLGNNGQVRSDMALLLGEFMLAVIHKNSTIIRL